MDDFLALRADCHLVRRLSTGLSMKPFAASLPLKVLALFAEPRDQLLYNREEALRSLVVELSQGQIQVRVEPQPTFPALIRALADYKPHVLHIMAHGSYRSEGGGGLALEDDFGGTHAVSARYFASQLRGSGVELVVLNSCLSGAGGGVSGFRGMTHALLRVGIPAVVAMQYVVPVVTAHRFSGALYHALSTGTALDEAVCIGRRVLRGDASLPGLDWVIPVLYIQGEQWSLFSKGDEEARISIVERPMAQNNLGNISHLRPTHLFGRAVEMTQVARALRNPLQRRRFVTVTGLGGIGKTAVAVESAFWHWERNYFPDGVFGVSAKDISYLQLLSNLG